MGLTDSNESVHFAKFLVIRTRREKERKQIKGPVLTGSNEISGIWLQ